MAHWNKRTVVREIKMADPVSGGSRFRWPRRTCRSSARSSAAPV